MYTFLHGMQQSFNMEKSKTLFCIYVNGIIFGKKIFSKHVTDLLILKLFKEYNKKFLISQKMEFCGKNF